MTALVKYEGKSSEHELSFEYGDLIKIKRIIEKDPNWALAELKPKQSKPSDNNPIKQGYILLNYVKPKSKTMQLVIYLLLVINK